MNLNILNTTYLLFVLVALKLFLFIEAANVYVSQVKSNDSETCGNYTSPCLSLEYAISHIAKPNDIVRLDGGETEQLTYIISSTIVIGINLTITNYNQSLKRPVLTGFRNLTSLFVASGEKIKYFHVSNLNFRLIAVINFLSSNISVTVASCNFSYIDYFAFYGEEGTDIFLTITKSQFFRAKILRINPAHIGRIILERCIVKQDINDDPSEIINVKGKFQFLLSNCVFSNIYDLIALESTSANESEVVIQSSVFLNLTLFFAGIHIKHVRKCVYS